MGYRDGVHAPVGAEHEPVTLTISGTLPEELVGTFARNSPDNAFPPPGRHHWFDGDGMVHALTLGDGRAIYRCRRIRTAAAATEAEAGRALWGGILDPIAPPGGPPLKDTANTHLVGYRGRLLASWWLSGTPLELRTDNLETLGPPPFVSELPPGRTVAAHPKVDPDNGELLFFGYRLHRPPWYWVGIADRDGNLIRTAEIDVAGPRIPHDIGITRRFVVILDLPLGWDLAALAEGRRRIGFERDAPARFGLWPRDGSGEVRWFDVPPCYVYHLTSSYEECGPDGAVERVIVTGCRIDDPIPERPDETGKIARLDTIHLAPITSRWTLDLRTGSASVETLDDRATEFPRVRDTTWTRAARYAYHPRIAPDPTLQFDGFLKLDHQRGTSAAFDYPEGWRGGEVVFAPRPGGQVEDDGWVLTVLSHPDQPRSMAWVLDARELSAGPVAQIELPWRIPLGFHAEWV